MCVGVSVSVCRCSLRFLRLGWVLSTWEMAVHLTATSHVLVSVLSFAVFFLRFFSRRRTPVLFPSEPGLFG